MPSFPQTAEIDPNDTRSYDVIPAGWYNAELVGSEVKTAKTGNGEYISLQFALLDPPHVNRRVLTILSLWHTSADTVRIANQQRMELLSAVGRPAAQTTEELYGIPLMVKLAVRKDPNGQYEDRNDIKGFKPAAGAAPRPASAPRATTAAPAAAAKKPWEK